MLRSYSAVRTTLLSSVVARTASSSIAASSASSSACIASSSSAIASFPSSSSCSSSSLLFFTPSRGIVIDRAEKRVGQRRRARRAMLRNVARSEAPGILRATRAGNPPPALASLQNSSQNLNQFLQFLARQVLLRRKAEAAERTATGEVKELPPTIPVRFTDDALKPTESTMIAREAAQAAWSLDFEKLRVLMEHEKNETFRACEEIVGALSDPTTDLGQKGLSAQEFRYVIHYIRRSMDASFKSVRERYAEKGGVFQDMEVEDQFLIAGVHSMRYLCAKVMHDSDRMHEVLLAARSEMVNPPPRTPLAEAMKYDVYPDINKLKAEVAADIEKEKALEWDINKEPTEEELLKEEMRQKTEKEKRKLRKAARRQQQAERQAEEEQQQQQQAKEAL